MMVNRTIQPPILPIEQIIVPQPIRQHLENGVPLRILKGGSQEVIRLDLVIKGGRSDQKKRLQAYLTNKMLREGSLSRSSAQISEQLDFYGSWLQLSTGVSHSYVSLYSLTKYFNETLAIVLELFTEPTFPQKELDTLLAEAKQQFQIEENKVSTQCQKAFSNTLLGAKHPCTNYPVLEDYSNLTTADLKSFYATHYRVENLRIYLSGNVNSDILKSVEDAFGSLPSTKETLEKPLFPSLPSLTQKRVIVKKLDSMQSALRIGMLSMQRQDPDYFKFRVLNTLLGGYFGSRLMSNIREDKGYTYGIHSGMSFFPEIGFFTIQTQTANEHVPNVIKEVYFEMDRLKTELVSEQELLMVKNYLLGQVCRSFESAFSLADAWMHIEGEHLPENYYSLSVQAIQKVTALEIQQLAQKHLLEPNFIEVIVGNPAN